MGRLAGRSVKRQYGITSHHGPLATIYTCPCCKHFEKFTNGRAGTGKGHGLREGGACYSRMVAHVRKDHPDQPRYTK